eukprot:TRINITY_DN6367_c0_g3_i1.p1 TRINITY_DN6367_c0_g3~~TRINITY_DN6367_c0_g3_i1.p1  ORF type:complete len:102 (+),score=1.15 TRINITY_DN6367_c0_g3_i1:945-1250(+)
MVNIVDVCLKMALLIISQLCHELFPFKAHDSDKTKCFALDVDSSIGISQKWIQHLLSHNRKTIMFILAPLRFSSATWQPSREKSLKFHDHIENLISCPCDP